MQDRCLTIESSHDNWCLLSSWQKNKMSYFPESVLHILMIVVVCRKIDSCIMNSTPY